MMRTSLLRFQADSSAASLPRAAAWAGVLLCVVSSCADPSYGTAHDDGAAISSGRATDAARPRPADSVSADTGVAGSRDDSASTRPADAGEPSSEQEGAPDAALPGAQAPSWALPLIGRYAVRAFAFKQDEFNTVTRSEQIWLAEFALDDSGMQLASTLCKYTAHTELANLELAKPSSLPRHLERVAFQDAAKTWTTAGETLFVGYTQQPAASCQGTAAGASVTHAPEQSWFASNTCRCALREEPPLADDCRLRDPDEDMHAGITYLLRGINTTIVDTDYYVASAIDTHYKNGKVAADGEVHSANVEPREDVYELGCSVPNCAHISKLGTYCPASRNPAQFVRLDPAAPTGLAGCAAVLSQAATLFEAPPPSPPPSCI
ncbi:MAG: hypothetical protein JWN48_118 [Myxococcaceae bacterium]|nr:hypothetical protein [Myxococcaceae bacterium]